MYRDTEDIETKLIAFEQYKNNIVSFATTAFGLDLNTKSLQHILNASKNQHYIIIDKNPCLISNVVMTHNLIFKKQTKVAIITDKESNLDTSKNDFKNLFFKMPDWLSKSNLTEEKNTFKFYNNSQLFFVGTDNEFFECFLEGHKFDLVILDGFDSFNEKTKNKILDILLSDENCRIIKT